MECLFRFPFSKSNLFFFRQECWGFKMTVFLDQNSCINRKDLWRPLHVISIAFINLLTPRASWDHQGFISSIVKGPVLVACPTQEGMNYRTWPATLSSWFGNEPSSKLCPSNFSSWEAIMIPIQTKAMEDVVLCFRHPALKFFLKQ